MTLETATFALGCFWGPDARFGVLPGVIRTRVGYTGGTTPNPTYRAIGDHAEALQVDFDPQRITYRDLLGIFWKAHNPDRQVGKRQYINAVWYHDAGQQAAITETAAALDVPVRTEIAPLGIFTRAEDYHQKWNLRHHDLMAEFAGLTQRDFTDSTAAARVNGFIAGHGTAEQLQAEIASYALSQAGQRTLRALVSEAVG